MFEPKITAIGASIGFVLSFLIGIVSGAPFIVVLARALGMSILFGVLVILGRIVILRFIPELLSPPEGDAVSDSGNIIDITVGDDSREHNLYGGIDSGDSSGMVPDFLETKDQSTSVPTFQPVEHNGSLGESMLRQAEQETSDHKTAKSKTTGGLDVLPDLQDFIPKETSNADSDEDEGSSISEGIGARDSLISSSDLPASTVESETMVKAIRTILAKDN